MSRVLAHSRTSHCAPLSWRMIHSAACAAGREEQLSSVLWVLSQGVKANASVTLTLSFSSAPGDPQVNRSQSPSKCWCIFSGVRSELGAVPGQRLHVMGLAPRSIKSMGQ